MVAAEHVSSSASVELAIEQLRVALHEKAEQELARQRAELAERSASLDARSAALDRREADLDARERALGSRERELHAREAKSSDAEPQKPSFQARSDRSLSEQTEVDVWASV
eukprot:TRINITY_DN4076_c0_g1_i1.p2 TRINITY_DN4076_c0_g1~~TRINITY_DN4076_c0_g1_i1.p2  ORF type:complete len:112 (-),score=31.47 TRINITY_DN4076_c0_g1_i1:318-653(-)